MPPVTLKAVLGLAVLVTVFILVFALAQSYQDVLGALVRAGGAAGVAAFICLAALFTIFIVPLDVSLLLPVAASAWGPVATALMSVAGWTLGSAIALTLARRYGLPLVYRLASEGRVEEGRRAAPQHHVFWWALCIQALAPIDLISYAFGLFTEIRLAPYLVATALGNLVPAFFFAFAGVLPAWYQALAFVCAFGAVGLFVRRARGRLAAGG